MCAITCYANPVHGFRPINSFAILHIESVLSHQLKKNAQSCNIDRRYTNKVWQLLITADVTPYKSNALDDCGMEYRRNFHMKDCCACRTYKLHEAFVTRWKTMSMKRVRRLANLRIWKSQQYSPNELQYWRVTKSKLTKAHVFSQVMDSWRHMPSVNLSCQTWTFIILPLICFNLCFDRLSTHVRDDATSWFQCLHLYRFLFN